MVLFRKKKRKKREPGDFMNAAVIMVLSTVFTFTVVWTIGFFIKGSEPATLITCFFAFMGIGGGCMAWIKNVKTKHGKKQEKKPAEPEEIVNEEDDGLEG